MSNVFEASSNIITRFKGVIRILPSLWLILGLSSCASMGTNSLYIHDVEKAEQASAANNAADKLKLSDGIQAERTNQAKMLARELSLVEEFSVVRRDTAIRALLEPRFVPGPQGNEALSTKAQRFIAERLVELNGSEDFQNIQRVKRVRDRIKSGIDNEVHGAVANLKDMLVQVPPFKEDATEPFELAKNKREVIIKEAVKKNPTEKEEVMEKNVNELLDDYERACNQVVELNKVYATLVKDFKAINQARKQVINTKAKKIALEKELKDGKKVYADAVIEVKEAQENLKKDSSKDAENELYEKVENIRKALNNLIDVAGVFGQREAAKEQIKHIDALLGVVSKNSSDNTDPTTAQAVVAQLPSFYGRVVEIAAIRKIPSINALILEKSRLQALRTGAEKGIKRLNTEIKLLEGKYANILAENQLLLDARRSLKWAERSNQSKAVTYENLKDPKISEDARRHTIMGITLYLGTFTGPQRATHEAEYRLIALKHQAALDRSETALVLWQVAIARPTKSLSAYYAGGLKPEHFIELLKALGLGAIAIGVN